MKKTYTTPEGVSYNLFRDALEQPHLLIAGATGSGKSVIINGLIAEMLQRFPFSTPGSANMILIDPKRVELSEYKDMPHTLKYASEPPDMLAALAYAMQLTERRYIAMQQRGLKKAHASDVYVIIDEFADLMTTQRHAVSGLIQRLAQIGRAAKVHLIVATQTPIAKVLPTEIKCNFDARIGLRARSAQDSRNILDHAGLELLPRYGQGVYMTPDGETLYNIPYVTDDELHRLADHWRQQTRPKRHFLHRLTKKHTFAKI